MLTVAVRAPAALGSNLIWKVVVPVRAATLLLEGWATMLKSAALAPVSVTMGMPVRLNAPDPVFLMVKVCVTAPRLISTLLPKSEPLAVVGEVSALGMAVGPAPPVAPMIGVVVPMPLMAKV